MTDSARQVHDNDEMIADMRAMGAGLGAMFEELRARKVSESHARDVLCEYLVSINQDKPEEEEDD